MSRGVFITLVALWLALSALLAACSVGTSVQQTMSGNPVEHQMGNGVVCYTYDQGLSCLRLP